ncbi:fimbrial biogenesis chaperone [Paraburkholderia megapolitana]|uniref:Fimbrial chaperone protein n=1 Tax=Paraburkholderia megapolitana TaxID=420953 RepID=A0A1I3Q506_9BURK|nr:molecular chaperone [Paraburkholderia megapolitana]QDQ81100.1 molecular chaperone [Paraburkholderia megapolitana]SFJ28216.1 fimbrial chaperone protein [Paraburkholderia megapolitana]
MIRFRRCLLPLLVAAGLLLSVWPLAAPAATLQISPVMVDMQAEESASGVTLRNPGDSLLYGQVRVFRWDQVNGEDTLTPTQDLIASPPLIQIAAQNDQLVRLVRVTPGAVATEQSFRILIDELPQPNAAPTNGVTIRLRYSVPVFIEPASAAGQPSLSWRLVRTGQGWVMHVANTGTKRAQIAAVQLVSGTGSAYVINKGLLGYALAGRAGQWQVLLPPNADLGGTVRVRASVNSLPVEAVVTVEHPG